MDTLMDRLAAKPATCAYASIAALIVVVVCLKLVYFERWLFDNDNYITLSTFFLGTSDPEYIASAQEFYQASVGSCNPQDKRCIAYSGVIHGKQTYARPLIAFGGSFATQPKFLSSDVQFLAGITKATIFQVVASTALVVSLLLCFLLSLPRSVAAFVAATVAVLGIVVYLLPEHITYWKYQFFLGVNFVTALVALLIVAVAWLFAWMATSPRRFSWDAIPPDRAIYALSAATVAILALRFGAAQFPALYFGWPIPGAQVGAFVVFLSLLGMTTFAGAIALAARQANVSASVVWMTVVLLFGFVATGEVFFATSFHIAPRGHIFLLAIPFLIYLALRPNGWALWLLPLFGFFHVAVVGLFCGCIIVIEIICGVRRRSFSVVLAVAAVVLIASIAHTVMTSGNTVVSSDAESLSQLLSRISILRFLPGLAIAAVLAVAGYAAWRMPNPAGDLFLRAIVLAVLFAGAGQLREVFESAGFDLLDPGAYHFILLWYYLAPIACGAGTILVLLGFAASAPGFDARSFSLNPRTSALLVIGLVALAAARGGTNVGQPPNAFVAIARAAHVIATGDSRPVDPLVREAAAPNDRYLVGPHPGDTITMMSILKMKARSTAGLLDPKAVRIDVIKRRP